MNKKILIMAALLAGAWSSSATVTVQGWWHYGEIGDYYADSSGNLRRFNSAFSRVGSGNAGAGVEPFGCGGPLGTTGFISTNCLYWTPTHADAAGMWDIGYNPPPTNYTLECWCLPEYPGTKPGNGSWLFCSGTSGGVAFVLTNDAEGTMAISARVVPLGNNVTIGDPWVVDTNRWNHLAIVNNNGTNTFYVNGVQHGAPSDPSLNTVPAGAIYGGSASGTQPTYTGYLDELRLSTFAPGQFGLTDLITRAMSPNIIIQPQSASVWTGGAAPFTIGIAFDNTTTYQWQRGGANISGATNPELYLNTVAAGDSGAQIGVLLNNSTGIPKTSSTATLTVVPVQTANNAAYRSAVRAESSLVAYYTIDNDTGTTLADTKGANTGTLEGTAEFDGRTTRSYGVRALRLKNTGDGDVTIPNNAVFEFASGNGTIEALVYLDQALSSANETIFGEAYDATAAIYYQIAVSADGTSLIYNSDSLSTPLSWAIPVPLVGRLAHVAVVFNSGNVTAYVDGLPLGTKTNPGFGSTPGAPAWIGSVGLNSPKPGAWCGSIDELAVYTSALPANTIAIHNSKFLYGTNTAPPTITALPATGTKTLLAGGMASFTVGAAGTAPLAYQWTTNGVPIVGATSSTLILSPSSVGQSATYGVTISNPYGSTNSPTFNLVFTAPPDRYATIVMHDNPMAFWRLDETSGTTAFDAAGGHDGAYSGSMTLGAPGALPGIGDSGVHFTGGNAEVPFSATLNPATAFSVEFWAKPDVQTIYTPICSQYRNGSARLGWCFYMENDADSWECHLGYAGGVALYAYGGGPVPLPGQFYHVVEVYDGAGNSTLYAENQLVGHNTQVNNGGVYVPNPSAPLEIGVRNGGSFPFNGVLDEVAIYNYALTTDQISNHWSIKFQPSAIVTQPVGVTNIEGSTVTLSATASGFPLTYQWYKDNVALYQTFNTDSTPHYVTDVTNSSLVISETTPSDSGQYYLVVMEPLPGGNSQTIKVNVLITPDTNPPVVASVQALGTPNSSGGPSPFLAKVTFNKRVDQSTASMVANYAINGGVTISSAFLRTDTQATALGNDWRTVILQTSGLTPGQKYTLTVSGVKDQATTPNTIVSAPVSFWAPPLTHGVLWWDFYSPVTPQGVVYLQGNANYPYAPATNWFMTAFDTHQITGTSGDLNNSPAFGSLGDNYGDCLSGWITPTVTGDYTFFLASDDASELDLSPDSTVMNAVMIAYEPGCCKGFLDTTNSPYPTQTSQPQHLLANTPYFIRALHTEGGGGDYVEVAWRLSTDTTPAVNLSPIPARYLSAFALLPPTFNAPVINGNQLTISWNNPATLLQSTDLKTWTPVAGSPISPFHVTVNPLTPHIFYRLQQ